MENLVNHLFAVIASKHRINKSAVSDIKQDLQKFIDFKKQTLDIHRHVLSSKDYETGKQCSFLDKAV